MFGVQEHIDLLAPNLAKAGLSPRHTRSFLPQGGNSRDLSEDIFVHRGVAPSGLDAGQARSGWSPREIETTHTSRNGAVSRLPNGAVGARSACCLRSASVPPLPFRFAALRRGVVCAPCHAWCHIFSSSPKLC